MDTLIQDTFLLVSAVVVATTVYILLKKKLMREHFEPSEFIQSQPRPLEEDVNSCKENEIVSQYINWLLASSHHTLDPVHVENFYKYLDNKKINQADIPLSTPLNYNDYLGNILYNTGGGRKNEQDLKDNEHVKYLLYEIENRGGNGGINANENIMVVDTVENNSNLKPTIPTGNAPEEYLRPPTDFATVKPPPPPGGGEDFELGPMRAAPPLSAILHTHTPKAPPPPPPPRSSPINSPDTRHPDFNIWVVVSLAGLALTFIGLFQDVLVSIFGLSLTAISIAIGAFGQFFGIPRWLIYI
jgi:hypothetical protein